MPPRGWAACASALAAAGVVAGPVAPLGQRHAVPGPDDSARAVRLLHRAALAHANVAYRGTRMVSAWGVTGTTTVVLEVRHVPGQGTTLRVRGAGSSSSSVTFLAQREVRGRNWATLEGSPLGLLINNYALTVTGYDRVAGRRAAVVAATRNDVATATFWVDRSTGLLVRREVYDAEGRLVRVSAFVDVRIQQPRLLARAPARMPQPDAVTMSVASLSRLSGRGWHCPRRLPDGFRITDVRRVRTESAAVQASYSDGLSTVSVFEQRGALDPAAVRGFRRTSVSGTVVYVRYGLPTYVTWASDGSVYTAVTDAPMTYLPRLVEAYPSAPEPTGFWDRVWRGSGRLLGWLAPAAARL